MATATADKNRDFVAAVVAVSTADLDALDVQGLEDLAGLCGSIRGMVSTYEAGIVVALEARTGPVEAEKALQRKQRLSKRRAARKAKTAKATSENSKLADALSNGEISDEHADTLADAEHAHEGAIDALLDDAKDQSVDLFRHTARGWRRAEDGDDGDDEATRQHRARKVRSWIRHEDGMGVTMVELDPVNHGVYIACLAYFVRRLKLNKCSLPFDFNKPFDPAQSDAEADRALLASTPQQQLADAHMAMVASSINPNNGVAAQTAQIVVIANYDVVTEALTAKLGHDGTPISAATLRRLACNAEILPTIFNGENQPLDLGRTSRGASPAQRTLLVARDQGCRGCDAPHEFCQAHHIWHWIKGGPTDIDNLVLLCNRCHHLVHEGRYLVHKTTTGHYTIVAPPQDQSSQTNRAHATSRAHAATGPHAAGRPHATTGPHAAVGATADPSGTVPSQHRGPESQVNTNPADLDSPRPRTRAPDMS